MPPCPTVYILTLDCIVSAYIYVGKAFEVRLENGHISERLHRREKGILEVNERLAGGARLPENTRDPVLLNYTYLG